MFLPNFSLRKWSHTPVVEVDARPMKSAKPFAWAFSFAPRQEGPGSFYPHRLFLTVLFLTSALHAAETTPEDLLRQGLFEEEANRNFDKAAEQYRAVVAAHDRQRALAATATFRLGEIARKKNDKETAANAFRTVVERFPEQADLARMSRENLAALGMAAAVASTPEPSVPQKDPEDVEIERLKNLARTSPDLIDGATENGWRPLHLAAANGQMKVMAYLLENKVDVNSRTTGEQFTPLQLAAINGHLTVVNALLAANAKMNDGSALPTKVIPGLPPMDERVEAPFGTWTPLDLAVLYDRREIARALIKAGADIKRTGPSLATPYDRLHTVLQVAIYLQRIDTALILIEAGAPLVVAEVENSPSALNLAVRYASTLIPTLLKAGADVNFPSGQKFDVPLQLAVGNTQPDLAKLLIESGANVKAVNANGQTALHDAGTPELVELLIAKGADPNAKDAHGLTPLDRMVDGWADPARTAAFVKLLETDGVVVDAKSLLARASSKRLPIVREKLVYPKEYRADAVLLSVENEMRPSDGANWIDTIEIRPAPGSPAPSIADGLGLFYRSGSDRSAIRNLKIIRRDAKGLFVAVFDWSPKVRDEIRKDLPSLEWGDILEVTVASGDSTPFPRLNGFLQSLSDRTVTTRLEGVSSQRKLIPSSDFWLGDVNSIKTPGAYLQQQPQPQRVRAEAAPSRPINELPLIPYFADALRVSVIRKGVDNPISLDLSVKGARPFRLLDGDVIELKLFESVRSDMRENNKQLVLSSDMRCGGVMEKKGLIATLASCAEFGNIATKIDFRTVRILHGGDVGKEEALDLTKLFPRGGWGKEVVAKADTLQAGDWILLSPMAEDAGQPAREASANMSATIQYIARESLIPYHPPAPGVTPPAGR